MNYIQFNLILRKIVALAFLADTVVIKKQLALIQSHTTYETVLTPNNFVLRDNSVYIQQLNVFLRCNL